MGSKRVLGTRLIKDEESFLILTTGQNQDNANLHVLSIKMNINQSKHICPFVTA